MQPAVQRGSGRPRLGGLEKQPFPSSLSSGETEVRLRASLTPLGSRGCSPHLSLSPAVLSLVMNGKGHDSSSRSRDAEKEHGKHSAEPRKAESKKGLGVGWGVCSGFAPGQKEEKIPTAGRHASARQHAVRNPSYCVNHRGAEDALLEHGILQTGSGSAAGTWRARPPWKSQERRAPRESDRCDQELREGSVNACEQSTPREVNTDHLFCTRCWAGGRGCRKENQEALAVSCPVENTH